MSNKLQAAHNLITLVNLFPSDFNCPKGYRMLPKNGWKERAYYVVEVAFAANNPIHRKIFFSGFLQDGEPAGYNGFAVFGGPGYRLEIKDAYFLKVICEIDIDSINIEVVNP